MTDERRVQVSHTSHGVDPVFTPREGTWAAQIGSWLRRTRPVIAAVAVWIVAFVVLSGVIVGLGLLLIHVLSPAGGTRFDSAVSRWFVTVRTPTLDTVTSIGSDLGSTGVVIGVAVLAAIVLAIGRHWRQIGFLACAMTLEFSVFLPPPCWWTVCVPRFRGST